MYDIAVEISQCVPHPSWASWKGHTSHLGLEEALNRSRWDSCVGQRRCRRYNGWWVQLWKTRTVRLARTNRRIWNNRPALHGPRELRLHRFLPCSGERARRWMERSQRAALRGAPREQLGSHGKCWPLSLAWTVWVPHFGPFMSVVTSLAMQVLLRSSYGPSKSAVGKCKRLGWYQQAGNELSLMLSRRSPDFAIQPFQKHCDSAVLITCVSGGSTASYQGFGIDGTCHARVHKPCKC